MRTFLLLSPAVAVALFAQTATPELPVQPANSRLVEISVVVTEKDEPITDLTAADFTLFDKGKPQKIASFVPVHPSPAAASVANVFHNRPDPGGSITAVLLDGLNTDPRDQTFARQQFAKALGEIKPSDHVVVFTLGTQLRVLKDIRNTSDDWLADVGVNSALNLRNRVAATAAALVTIAQHIGHLPGRKNLVWVAGDFPVSVDHQGGQPPLDWEGLSNQQQTLSMGGMSRNTDDAGVMDRDVFRKLFDPAMQALVRNNITVYAADGRGLISPSASTTPAPSSGSRGRGQSSAADSAPQAPQGARSLRTLAEDTGGRVYESSNDIQRAIHGAINDAEAAYTLGYYPEIKAFNGSFHDLKVQVNRKGVDLSYRKGYLALGEQKGGEAQRVELMKSALSSPVTAGAIGLMASYERAEQPKAGCLRTAVNISAADLALQKQGEQWTGDIEVVLAMRSADGKDRGMTRQVVNLKLTQPQYEMVLKEGIAVMKTLEPTGEVAEIRALVSDRTSGKVGSVILPVR